ncbi:MAG TPA: deoxyribonuclease IV [Candidatus Babeliales bacterium]|nr:deoxyribonuclease IV [Candidatus Babeliales bacterium]
MKNRLGVHIRMRSSLKELLERADFLNLSFFQCFFVPQETGKLIRVTDVDVYEFLKVRRSQFADLFCHASYWVNLSSLGNNGYPQLRREIAFARRLEFTHLVLHAGTAKGAKNKNDGIDELAYSLNTVLRRDRDIAILLENTCHANLAIGSNILDFKLLLEKLDYPERIGFCIDTAHAHSFGYDIVQEEQQDAFIDFLDATIGIERIRLIHLNDTVEGLGSHIDRHVIVGQGVIGDDALKRFVMHPKLCHIPLLMELPELSVEQELLVLEKVRSW